MKLSPKRIKARLEELGKSAREVSMRVSGTPDLIRHILAGRQLGTSGEKLLRLAAELECSVDYLYERSAHVGEPPTVPKYDFALPDLLRPQRRKKKRGAPSRARIEHAVESVRGEVTEVPEYDVRVSAGHGSLVADEPVRRYWGMPRGYLDAIGVDAHNIAFVEVIGDSMAPTLMPGDLVMLDLRSTNPALPAIYALWDGDATVCKRLEKAHGTDKVRIISENRAYTTYEARVEDVRVIGRVAWFARRT
jgi:phage repressor protein C with HTH and peptisase S24 domain